jgi:trimethylamine:corrinoid methyltransferase-like protein
MGERTMAERAAARVDELLATHKPPPLPDAVVAAIDEILARAAATSGLSMPPA